MSSNFAVLVLTTVLFCDARLTRVLSLPAVEIGYTFYEPSVQRTHVNSETKLVMMRAAFEDWSCRRVSFTTGVANVRSQRAIERLGAKKDGVFRRHLVMPDGHVRDTVFYSVVENEWPLVKERLTKSSALRV